MATFERVNGIGHELNTLYSTLQLKVFKVTVSAALTTGIGGTAEALAREFGTTGALFEFTTNGKDMIIIGDGHALDADIVKIRADQVLGVDNTVVVEATSLVGITATA